MREPFFKKSHNAWYVRVGNRDVFLARQQEQAWQEYRRLLAYSNSRGEDATVAGVLVAYLEDLRPTVSLERYVKVSRYVKQFLNRIGEFREVQTLSKSEILAWLQEPKTRGAKTACWSLAAQRDAGQILRSGFRWAFNEGMISKNPAASLRLQQPAPRTTLIDYSTHALLVSHAMQSDKSRSFAQYLIASRCGARPQQIRVVRQINVFLDGQVWRFEDHKTRAKTGKPLTVPLPPCLQTLTRILQRFREDRLFLNDQGRAWTKDSVALRMRRLRDKLGLANIVAYSYRHTFATDALLAGASLATVAALLGHSDAKMVSQVYGHLDQHTNYLVRATHEVAKHRLATKREADGS